MGELEKCWRVSPTYKVLSLLEQKHTTLPRRPLQAFIYQLYHEPYINPRLDNFPQVSHNLRTILWDRLYSHFKDFYSGSERLNNLSKVPHLIHCGAWIHIQFSPSSEVQFSFHLNIFPLLNSNSLFNYLMLWI